MERTYSPQQRAYLVAKQAYEGALAKHNEELEKRNFPALLDTADDMELVRIEVEAQGVSHMDEWLAYFLDMEKELFAWGRMKALQARRAKTHKDEAALLKNMFDNIQKYPHLKGKLANICLALDANAADDSR